MFIRKTPARIQAEFAAYFSTFTWMGWKRRTTSGVERDGVFREAIEGIKAAKAAGFPGVFEHYRLQGNGLEEIAELFAYLKTLGVDGYMISPAYSYAAVQTKEIFMSREDIREKFQQASRLLERFQRR